MPSKRSRASSPRRAAAARPDDGGRLGGGQLERPQVGHRRPRQPLGVEAPDHPVPHPVLDAVGLGQPPPERGGEGQVDLLGGHRPDQCHERVGVAQRSHARGGGFGRGQRRVAGQQRGPRRRRRQEGVGQRPRRARARPARPRRPVAARPRSRPAARPPPPLHRRWGAPGAARPRPSGRAGRRPTGAGPRAIGGRRAVPPGRRPGSPRRPALPSHQAGRYRGGPTGPGARCRTVDMATVAATGPRLLG